MADAPADQPQEKTEKKKKEKNGSEEKKPKKSSVKKEKTKEPTKEENVPQDSLETRKKEEGEPKYVEAAAGPDLEPEAPVDPEAAVKKSEEPVPEVKPRPKRNYELEIDEGKLKELREAFDIFDFNSDGIIDKDDLRKIQIAMGQDVGEIDEQELDRMISEAYQPLDFESFVLLLGYKTIELDPEEVLRTALSKWDTDGTGLISEDKLRYDLTHLGDKFTEKEVDLVLQNAPLQKGFGFYKDLRMLDYVKFCQILAGLRKKTTDPTLEEYGLDVSA